MPPPPPPSRMPSVQDPATLGIGARAGVYDMYADSIEGEGVPKFFRNIARAFTHTWNEKPTKTEKAVLAPMLGSMKVMANAVAPEAKPLVDATIGGLQTKYGVGLYAGVRPPMGRGMCMGDRKVKQYIKRA